MSNKKEEPIIGDEYDVMGRGITVHTDSVEKWINEDFKFSDLNSRQAMLVQRTGIMLRHIVSYLDFSKHVKDQEISINGETIKRKGIGKDTKEKVDNVAEKITTRMMNDLQTLAILSSAKEGRIVKATVDMMRKREKNMEEKETLKDKMKPQKEEEMQ